MADEDTTEITSEETTDDATTVEETTTSTTTVEPDLKRESRKWESRAKKSLKDLEQAQAKIKELETANASDSEKAIAKAREEAALEARAEAMKELRDDRLEVAVARHALAVKVTDGDGEEKTVKFADPDDALLRVQRAIRAGDLDEADIFDDKGKVQTDALTGALAEILERAPHLIATNGDSPKVKGSADGGKGSAGKGPEDQSAEDVFQSIRRTKP